MLLGKFKVEVITEQGETIGQEEVNNIITLQGLEYIARNIASSNPVTLGYIVLSDTDDPPALDETELAGNLQASAATVEVDGSKVTWSAVFFPVQVTVRRLGICVNSNGTGLFATTVVNQMSLPSWVRLKVSYVLELLP